MTILWIIAGIAGWIAALLIVAPVAGKFCGFNDTDQHGRDL